MIVNILKGSNLTGEILYMKIFKIRDKYKCQYLNIGNSFQIYFRICRNLWNIPCYVHKCIFSAMEKVYLTMLGKFQSSMFLKVKQVLICFFEILYWSDNMVIDNILPTTQPEYQYFWINSKLEITIPFDNFVFGNILIEIIMIN